MPPAYGGFAPDPTGLRSWTPLRDFHPQIACVKRILRVRNDVTQICTQENQDA